jgi:D-aminopeptidase
LPREDTQPLAPPSDPTRRVRARALGIEPGRFKPGKNNAITDVKGVKVGHSTIIKGSGPLVRGEGPVRTGVTAILPNAGNIFDERVVGSGFVLNGAGEVSGLTQVMEWGLIETPILLTNTLAVGAVSDATIKHMVKRFPGIGVEHDVIIPVVGECDDSWLSDIGGRHVKAEHVFEAIDSAVDGPVAEGNVGGGTGMITCDFSGGIGTSSRRVQFQESRYTVGMLVMSNFGHVEDLRVHGLPVGLELAPRYAQKKRREHSYGSIIAVLATDAPLLPHQLHRVCKRVALGIGRAGSYAAHGSGEIIVGFSNANTIPRTSKHDIARVKFLLDEALNPLYAAAVEATEEAILNAICMGTDMEGAEGHFAPALPLEDVRAIVSRFYAARGGPS